MEVVSRESATEMLPVVRSSTKPSGFVPPEVIATTCGGAAPS